MTGYYADTFAVEKGNGFVLIREIQPGDRPASENAWAAANVALVIEKGWQNRLANQKVKC